MIKDITPKYLNDTYGDKGKTFKTENEAKSFAKTHEGSLLYRLVDHASGLAIREKRTHCIGWLVTIHPGI